MIYHGPINTVLGSMINFLSFIFPALSFPLPFFPFLFLLTKQGNKPCISLFHGLTLTLIFLGFSTQPPYQTRIGGELTNPGNNTASSIR